MLKLDSNSKFNIYSSFTLSNDDVNVISLLYTPLMGSDALMLYLGFQSLLERNNLKSEEIIHQDFYDIFSIKPNAFINARSKLEAIGLLVTYYNEDDKSYVYVLCPPLTAKNFIKDATLGLYLYANVRRETFDFIKKHFEIERIDKKNLSNVTKTFDEVYSSQLDNDITYDKFKYILGKKPNKNITIKDYKFDFDKFKCEINLEFLEVGITKAFVDQICRLAFVYGFDEMEMASLYHDSINKSGVYDYRLLKNKANILFVYKRNMKAPKLVSKNEDSVTNDELTSYLENTPPAKLLDDVSPNYPDKYLQTINDIYANIDLPRGVLNCMIMKLIKDKSGDLPNLAYFKRVSESWIKDNVFSTADAIKYVTTLNYKGEDPKKKNDKNDINSGWDEL